MSQIIMDKDDLIAHLVAQRKLAVEHDKANLADHRKAEAAFLAEFRAAAKEAAKWDYARLRKAPGRYSSFDGRSIGIPVNGDFPSCPTAVTPRFDAAIQQVKLSKQASYTMSTSGVHADLFALVTWTPHPAPKDVCS